MNERDPRLLNGGQGDLGRIDSSLTADHAAILFGIYDYLAGVREDGEPIEVPAEEVEILVRGGCTLGDFQYAVQRLVKRGYNGTPWGFIRTVAISRRAMVMRGSREAVER